MLSRLLVCFVFAVIVCLLWCLLVSPSTAKPLARDSLDTGYTSITSTANMVGGAIASLCGSLKGFRLGTENMYLIFSLAYDEI